MAREIDDESAADVSRDSSVLEELHNVEEVARVLAVHRCDQLAAIDVFERHRRNLKVGLERVARTRCQRCHAYGVDRATHDKIHLDFDFDTTLPNEQFGCASIR